MADALRSKYKICFDGVDDAKQVFAYLENAEDTITLSLPKILEELTDAGFGTWHIFEQNIVGLMKSAMQGDISARELVAERRDAKSSISISNSLDQVEISIEPPKGGHALDYAHLCQLLKDQGVIPRCIISQSEWTEVYRPDQTCRLVVARMIPPKMGEDSRFELLINDEVERNLEVGAKGEVNFRQAVKYESVAEGTEVLRRHPPTVGTPGLNVKGQAIPAQPGKELEFSRDCDGVRPKGDDPDVLVAALTGHPRAIKQGVVVEKVIRLKHVNLASGSVHFDGSVHVEQDVAAGMEIRVSGDIIVGGTVEKAHLVAGHNIVVAKGVLGDHIHIDSQAEPPDQYACLLEAGNCIEAKFVNVSKLVSHQDVIIHEYAFNSDIRADNALLVGQDHGKGVLVGGRNFGRLKVVANTIGSEGSAKTYVYAGQGHKANNDGEQYRQQIEELQAKLKKALPDYMKAKKLKKEAAHLSDEQLQQIAVIKQKVRELTVTIKALQKRLHSLEDVQPGKSVVQVARKLHSSVVVAIDGVDKLITRDHGPTQVLRQGRELHFSTFKPKR